MPAKLLLENGKNTIPTIQVVRPRQSIMPKTKHTEQAAGIEKLRVENASLNQENLKLQRRIITLETQIASGLNKIIALKVRLPLSKLTDEELKERIVQGDAEGLA